MTTTINGRTPEEIKKGLKFLGTTNVTEKVELASQGLAYAYYEDFAADTLAYIQQLENHIGGLTEKVAQFEAAQPKWVSVNDMLPEKDGKYIVCTAKGSVYCTRFKAYGKSGSFQTDINTHITHWMSLPEPPEVRA